MWLEIMRRVLPGFQIINQDEIINSSETNLNKRHKQGAIEICQELFNVIVSEELSKHLIVSDHVWFHKCLSSRVEELGVAWYIVMDTFLCCTNSHQLIFVVVDLFEQTSCGASE